MAVTVTLVATTASAGSTTTSTSFTSQVGKYYLAVWRNGVGSTSGYPSTCTTTAGTIAFSLINRTAAGAAKSPNCGIYGGYCTAAGTGTVSQNYSSTSNCVLHVFELGGVTATGAIVQNAVGNGTTGTSVTSTLSAFDDANNATFFVAASATSVTHTADSGFTKIDDDGGIPNNQYSVYTGGASDTTPSMTLGASGAWAMVALEIKALRTDTVGPLNPTAASTTGGSTSWSNTGNVYSSDNTYATVVPVVTNSSNTYLDVTGFGFQIPSAGTVVKVLADIEAKSSGNSYIDTVQLLKAGSPVGTTYTLSQLLTGTDAIYSIPAADLWGTTVAYTDANDSGFGLRIRFRAATNLLNTYPGYVGTAGSATSTGGSISWSNLTNISSNNNAYLTQTAPSSTAASNDYLNCVGFGHSIPSTATIVSIATYIGRRRNGGTGGNIQTETLQLLKAGTPVGSNLAPGTTWTATDTDELIDDGGVGQLWGTTWSYSDINDANFGFRVRVKAVDPSTTSSATFGSTAANSGAGVSWANTGNVFSSNNAYASITFTGSSANVAANYNYIDITGFGFSIPSNATIRGVTASIERSRTGGSTGEVRFDTIQLIKAGTRGGTNLANATNFPTADAAVSFGGAANLWGNTLTYTDINASNFGISIRCVGSTAGTNRVANLDGVTLVITYSTPSSRDAQIDYAETDIYYSMPDTGTVSVDTVRMTLNTTGAPLFIASLAENETVTPAIIRARTFAASLAETMAYAFVLTVTASLVVKDFQISLAEAASVAVILARQRNVALSYAEAETIAVDALQRARTMAETIAEAETVTPTVSRIRTVASVVAETEVVSAALQRARTLAISLAETETVDVVLQKIKGLSFLVAETYTDAVAAIARIRNSAPTVSEAETVDVAVSRLRKVLVAVTELETVLAAINRARLSALAIAELETITTLLARLRPAAITIAELETVSAVLNKLKSLSVVLSETETMSVSLQRSLKFVSLCTEIETVSSVLLRTRRSALTIAELETIDALLKRSRNIPIQYAEVQTVLAAMARVRNVAFSWSETETVSVLLGKLKYLTFAIMEATTYQVDALKRLRGLAEIIPESASYLAAVQRVRNIGTVIAEHGTCSVDFHRFRDVAIGIVEAQGVTAGSLRRIRGFAADISETTGCDIRLTVFVPEPNRFIFTATFDQWVELPNGTLDLQTKTLSWEVSHIAEQQQLAIPVGQTIALNIPYAPTQHIDISDLTDIGLSVP